MEKHFLRMFVGSIPDAPLCTAVQRWQECLPPTGVRWTSAEKLHLTLAFLPACPSALLSTLEEAVRSVAQAQKRFALPLRRSPTWINHRGAKEPAVLVALPVDDAHLQNLHAHLHTKMNARNLISERTLPFLPHLTLGRKNAARPSEKFPDLPALVFPVRSLCIVKTQQGPQHDAYVIWKKYRLQ
ncbi:MAG: RNA 2',3'-cyclic phosphodiesterase [bacterium]